MGDKVGEILRRLQSVTNSLALIDEEGLDISILVAKTQALICTNDEIWERCKPNQIIINTTQGETSGLVRLYRVAYPKLTVTSSDRGAANRSVVLQTHSELEVKSFPPLPPISKDVSSFFHIQSISENNNSPIRINYEECVASILCTKDDIARQFLILLKDHLAQVQVAFGEMERWLLDTGDGIQFINQTFNNAPLLRQPELGNGTCRARHGICIKCFEPYANHRTTPNLAPRHPKYYDSWCSNNSNNEQASYFVSTSHNLKRICIASPNDTYTLTFDLSMEDHRERLKRFLHLMEATELPPAPVVNHFPPIVNNCNYNWDSDSS